MKNLENLQPYVQVALVLWKRLDLSTLVFLALTVVRKMFLLFTRNLVITKRRSLDYALAPMEDRELGKTLISVIIPTRDGGRRLIECLSRLERNIGDLSIEYLLIDNGSKDAITKAELNYRRSLGWRVLTIDKPFNYAALNNEAARLASGDVLCFLNDDVMVDKPFLNSLAGLALVERVGAVGPVLTYPDGLVQHAGVYLWSQGAAYHLGAMKELGQLAEVNIPLKPHFVAAVTGACLVVQASKFHEVGGFTESFAVGLNDVDLCLKLTLNNYSSVLEPNVQLTHLESASRGKTYTAQSLLLAIEETLLFRKRWRYVFKSDPYSKSTI